MKNILHHGIVLHPKAQGKQHRWRCMGKGAILSRETMAPLSRVSTRCGNKKQQLCLAVPPAPKGAKKGRLFRGVPFNK